MTQIFDRVKAALADHYDLESHIGEGGMATVYLAHDLKHERKVAVKVLRPELAAILGGERFLNEIKVTANLQHPNILPLYDSGEADTFLYYVMPFVEGESLRQKMNREKQLGVEEAVEITKDVADALHFAHEQGIVHRDIKPENILLQRGKPLVADFGIALAVSAAGGSRLTETGLSLGTPHYMSPEQAAGDREVNARSDVYSLGCLLYEMLVGDPPHMGGSVQAVIAKVLTETPAAITQTRQMVPPNVEAAVRKALAKTSADRFATAAQFAEALANPGFRLPTGSGSPVVGSGSTNRWKRLAVVAATLAAVALLVVGLFATGFLGSSPPAPVVRFNVKFPEDQQILMQGGTLFSLSADGSKLVYVGPGEGDVDLWVRRLDALTAERIPETNGGDSPFLSPDGTEVAFTRNTPSGLYLVSLVGGPRITLAQDSIVAAGGGWGPGGYVYFHRSDGIRRVPSGGGEVELVTTLDRDAGEAAHLWLDVLPGGKGLLFTIVRGTLLEDSDIAVLDLATGEKRILLRGVFARYATSGHIVFARNDGALLAAPFDESTLQVTGSAIPLLTGVNVGSNGEARFTISATGTLLYQRGAGMSGRENLVWVDRQGIQTAVDPDWSSDFLAFALSPDERRVAASQFEENATHVWVKELDRGPIAKLTLEGTFNIGPSWTPDGRFVTFISNRGERSGLWQKRADGSAAAEILLHLEQPVQEGFWSPDGKWLIVRVNSDNSNDILGFRPGTDTVPVPLVASDRFDEMAPALSPDGRWLAYVSNESGTLQVYVRPFPNTNETRWVVSLGYGQEPVWSPRGNELFYKGEPRKMIAAQISTNPTFSVTARTQLFDISPFDESVGHPRYQVSKDGQRFLMSAMPQAQGGADLVFVLNWLEELKARTAN